MGQDADAVKECIARGRARRFLGPEADQQADDEEHADRQASAHVSRERHVPVRALPRHLGKNDSARGERDEDHDGHEPVQGDKKRVVSGHEASPSPVLGNKSETITGSAQSTSMRRRGEVGVEHLSFSEPLQRAQERDPSLLTEGGRRHRKRREGPSRAS